ncbi:MAG: hypothetical protein MUC97_03855 [Bernardetiaceae bacterium]|jgi:hypothetical protein|nr:hypothetical protein [Bernardetiaceae bacterium]
MDTTQLTPASSPVRIERLSPTQFHAFNKIGDQIYEYTYLPEYLAHINRWIGFADLAEVKAINHALIQNALQNKLYSKYSISDFSQFAGGFLEAMEWLSNELLPQIIQMGFKGDAVVKPTDFFAALTIDDAREQLTKLPYDQVFVDTFEQAMTWLVGKKRPV